MKRLLWYSTDMLLRTQYRILPSLYGSCASLRPSAHDAYSCRDDKSSFTFRNGASLHYRFSDVDIYSKSILKEIADMGLDLAGVDIVFSNSGNGEAMSFESLYESAQALNESGTLLVWLSRYYNGNSIYTGTNGTALRDLDVVQFDLSAR